MTPLRVILDSIHTVAREGALDGSVARLTYDSRQVEPDTLFVAVRGLWVDGHDYIDAAIAAGASAIVAETAPPADRPSHVTWLQVADSEVALGLAADAFYGRPSSSLKVLAVTGTNGKTTVGWLLWEMLDALGSRPGFVGTVEHRFAGVRRKTIFTTPPSADLHALLGEMRDAGCTHVALEASSHGLAQNRLAGLSVAVGGFTNLSRDHLDYHHTMEAYLAAKALLFRAFAPRACFNIDDPAGRRLAGDYAGETLTVSARGDASADLWLSELRLGLDGSSARLHGTGPAPVELEMRLIGRHNVENAMVALGMASLAGVPPGDAISALAQVHGAPGRLEPVPGPRHVVVDYAHTPDALENVLEALRQLTDGRVICVFGAGGDRDPGKRPFMGEVAARLADLPVVTSDNPRTEEPRAIIHDILTGVPAEARGRLRVEPDRRAAIALGISLAEAEDVVLIAGKGHEDYQILGEERIHFDDREEAAAVLATLGSASA